MEARKQAFMDKVAMEITSHYMKPNARREVARAIGFSENYMSTLFYQCSGIRFHVYLRGTRMLHAKALLRKPCHFTVKEVAHMVGYRNISAFTTAYTRFYGRSPAKDRRDVV